MTGEKQVSLRRIDCNNLNGEWLVPIHIFFRPDQAASLNSEERFALCQFYEQYHTPDADIRIFFEK